jgi:D-arginine dehydrogenase
VRIVVIGGGIAGLAAGWNLLSAGAHSVELFERETSLCTHSSGRNAAIYRPVEESLEISQLAAQSARLLDRLMGARREWLRETGLLLLSRSVLILDRLAESARRVGAATWQLRAPEIAAEVPLLRGGDAEVALYVPNAGVLDIHAISERLARDFRRLGGTIRTRDEVAGVMRTSDRAAGITLKGGDRLDADAVVLAGGAWALELAESCGATAPLAPLRRHLALLELAAPRLSTIVWDVEREFYLSPESGGLLASPGDAEPAPSLDYEVESRVLTTLFERAKSVAPAVAGAELRRLWSCLRTVTPDGLPLIGEDPRVSGLFWLAGLGGVGMSAGLGAGEALAEVVLRRRRAAHALSPSRFTARISA